MPGIVGAIVKLRTGRITKGSARQTKLMIKCINIVAKSVLAVRMSDIVGEIVRRRTEKIP